MLRKVTLAFNASTKRDFRERQLFFIICLENQWYYIYGFGYFLHQKDKTEKKKNVYSEMPWMQKSRKIFLPDFSNIQHSDDVCYQGCTHVEYLDKKEASLGKIFCFTWLWKSSFKSLASQHITGNIFLSKDKPQKRDVDLSGYRCSNYSFAKTCCDREGNMLRASGPPDEIAMLLCCEPEARPPHAHFVKLSYITA